METVTDFSFLGSKITAGGDCSHEIKRHLLLGRKVMINPDSILKSSNITLPTKVRLVKAMVFPVIMYGYESWTLDWVLKNWCFQIVVLVNTRASLGQQRDQIFIILFQLHSQTEFQSTFANWVLFKIQSWSLFPLTSASVRTFKSQGRFLISSVWWSRTSLGKDTKSNKEDYIEITVNCFIYIPMWSSETPRWKG